MLMNSTVWSVNDGLSGNLLEISGNRPRRFPAGFRQVSDFFYLYNFFFINKNKNDVEPFHDRELECP